MDQLAFYVNETLSDSDRRHVERHLDDHPAYQCQIAFYRALQSEIKRAVPERSPEVGLAATLARIEEESSRDSSGVAHNDSWFQRWFDGGFRPQHAYAVGLALLAGQLGVIGTLLNDRSSEFSETRSRPVVAAPNGPFIKVSFKGDAKEADIRFMLIGLGASIVGGPSQLGDYFLFLDVRRTDWAVQQLRQSPVVDVVTVTATLPVAKE